MSYADILDRYLIDLAKARDEVLVWWEGLLQKASPTGDTVAAEKAVRARWPLGPVSHPRIIATFRRYFLEVDAYNDAKQGQGGGANTPADPNAGWGQGAPTDEGHVEPTGLLLDSIESRDPELSAFMKNFVFISIGTDPDGNVA